MKRIEVRGIIVGSEYDDPFFQPYVDRGIITVESQFRKALAEIGEDEDAVEIYINSPGGSVFSGNEMTNALVDWRAARSDKRKNPRQVVVTVGALAASMGACMAVACSDVRRMHANGKLMFHSAWGGAMGGPGAMEDTAALLKKINDDAMRVLVGRFQCNPDEVAQWFQEGREGWLSASDAKARGLIDEIIDAAAPAGATVQFPEAQALAAKGLKLAACAGVIDLQTDAGGQGTVPAEVHTPGLAGSTPAPATTAAPATAAVAQAEALASQILGEEANPDKLIDQALAQVADLQAEVQKHKTNAAQFLIERDDARRRQAAADRAAAEAKTALAKASDDYHADLNRLTQEHEAAILTINATLTEKSTQIQTLQTQAQAHEQRLLRLTGAVLGNPSDEPDPSQAGEPATWEEALHHCGGNTDKAYAEARRRWPNLLLRHLEKKGARKNKTA